MGKAKEFKLITDIKKCVLFCHITSSYDDKSKRKMDINDKKDQLRIYQCTQGAWTINESKKPYIQYVFAIYSSTVVGIYKVSKDSWIHRSNIGNKYSYESNDIGKFEFPTAPKIREKEFYYSLALQNCKSENDIEKYLKKYKCDINLSVNDFKTNVLARGRKRNQSFENWQNRYFFKCDDNDIPADIKDFLGKILLFPIEKNKNITGK